MHSHRKRLFQWQVSCYSLSLSCYYSMNRNFQQSDLIASRAFTSVISIVNGIVTHATVRARLLFPHCKNRYCSCTWTASQACYQEKKFVPLIFLYFIQILFAASAPLSGYPPQPCPLHNFSPSSIILSALVIVLRCPASVLARLSYRLASFLICIHVVILQPAPPDNHRYGGVITNFLANLL